MGMLRNNTAEWRLLRTRGHYHTTYGANVYLLSLKENVGSSILSLGD